MWTAPETKGGITRTTAVEAERLNLVSEGCDTKFLRQKDVKLVSKDVFGEVSKTHHALQTLDKTISNLEMELAAAKATQESILSGAPLSQYIEKGDSPKKRKHFVVVGINTAFSSRKRRDSVRATWMPQGEKRKKLEEEKGIIMHFVIGHGWVLKKLQMLSSCKSGSVLAQKGVRYHEPEYWKFGETGNKYFRHATGQMYAISKDLASYISVNQILALTHFCRVIFLEKIDET